MIAPSEAAANWSGREHTLTSGPALDHSAHERAVTRHVAGRVTASTQHRASIPQLCRWLGVPRSTFYYRPPPGQGPKPPVVDKALEAKIRAGIDAEAVIGLRMITARIRRAADGPVNKKKIHPIIHPA
jgi:hypothetical protein